MSSNYKALSVLEENVILRADFVELGVFSGVVALLSDVTVRHLADLWLAID